METFNPYYKGDKYSFKRDYTFNDFNLDDNNNQFIKTSRKLEFERMFKDNIIKYLNKMVSKINEYFSLLKNKYEYIMNNVKKDKKSFTDKQLKEEVKIITKFFLFNKTIKIYLSKSTETEVIINLIDFLNEKEKTEFFAKIMNRCKFKPEEFFQKT